MIRERAFSRGKDKENGRELCASFVLREHREEEEKRERERKGGVLKRPREKKRKEKRKGRKRKKKTHSPLLHAYPSLHFFFTPSPPCFPRSR
jgi:hypothetical protein